jgi:endonuclease/exonuclease/phosphatase family metal-dependent hydrolase
LLASILPAQAGEKCADGKRDFKTMTANLYIGTGMETITALDPTDPNYLSNLVTAVTGVYYELLASQPPLRLQAMADRIVARMPDIVAVEEATLLRVQSPGDLAMGGSTPATDVVLDYLQILVDSLKARGAHYAVVSTSQEWDVEMPMLHLGPDGQPTIVLGPDGNPTYLIDDVRQTDREAILVRTDLPPGQLRVSHPQSGNFANLIVQGFPVTRGWCSIDVCFRGENFRYICTHLEEETSPDIQVAQAKELLAGPVRTCLPVVLVGDFNSDPLHRDRPKGQPTAYPKIIAAGFWDTWALLHPFHPAGGLTWGHDEFLAFPNVAFDRRIDFVFFRGFGIIPVKAEPIDISLGRTAPPLWASDHAALAAELFIK